MDIKFILNRVPSHRLLNFLPEWQTPYFKNDLFDINHEELIEYIYSIKFEVFNNDKKLGKLLEFLNDDEINELVRVNVELRVLKHNLKDFIKQLAIGNISKKIINDIKKELQIINFENIEIITYKEEFKSYGKRFYELFDYQMYIKEQLLNLILTDFPVKKVLVHMPTGTGKTKTTMHLVNQFYIDYMQKPGLIIWIAHTNILLEQAEETLETVWERLGKGVLNIFRIYSGIEYNIETIINNGGIIFCNISSLISLLKNNESNFNLISSKTNMIIFDEAHKILASESRRVISELVKVKPGYSSRTLIGLTATPGRSVYNDDENFRLAEYFDRTTIKIDVTKIDQFSLDSVAYANKTIDDKEIIKFFQSRGVLSYLKREVLDYGMDSEFEFKLKNIKKRFDESKTDYNYEVIKMFAFNVERNRAIIERLIELSQKSIPTLFFACSVEHGKFISSLLKSKLINVSEVYGETGDIHRHKEIEKFKNGTNNILINCSVLTTGFDSTNIKCVFIAKPTKSVVLYSQMIGRGLRGPKMGGNYECLLIDLKDNLDRFSDEEEAFSYFEEFWR